MSKPVTYRGNPVTVTVPSEWLIKVLVPLPATSNWREYNAHLTATRATARRAVVRNLKLVPGNENITKPEIDAYMSNVSFSEPMGQPSDANLSMMTGVLYAVDTAAVN